MAASVPAKVTFLSDLSAHNPGDKVRFLGWYVISKHPQKDIQAHVFSLDGYDTTTGVLTARHDYRSNNHVAKVTIEHVREQLPSTTATIGSWINIVGYVQQSTVSETTVQAVMLWTAGPMKLVDYERALQARKDAMSAS
jgi:hypothetical protein